MLRLLDFVPSRVLIVGGLECGSSGFLISSVSLFVRCNGGEDSALQLGHA